MISEETIEIDGHEYFIERYPIVAIAVSMTLDGEGRETMWTSYAVETSHINDGYTFFPNHTSEHLMNGTKRTLNPNMTILPAPPGSYQMVIMCDVAKEIVVNVLGIEPDLPELIRKHYAPILERMKARKGGKSQ